MNTIQLQRDGTFTREGGPAGGDPLPFLNHAVQLDASCTLRTVFLAFETYPDLVRLNPFFPFYLDQYRSSPESGCTTADFEILEFRKAVEMIGFPGDPRLEIFTSLKGVGPEGEVGIHTYGLQLLLDMPLKIGRLRHVIFGDDVDIFEFDTFITLFEFVDGLAWELSFQNLPQKCEIRR